LEAFGLVKKICFVIVTAVGMVHSNAQPIDLPKLSFTEVAPHNFDTVTCITHAGDSSGRLFVGLQGGQIWIVQSNQVLATPFLNLAATVNVQQLCGVAFPPGFATNKHFYVSYTRNPDRAACLSRFQVTSNLNVADTSSEQALLVIPEPGSYDNHAIGQIAFGPDGFLYIGSGDGDSYPTPQNPKSLQGKLLRIDVEGGAFPYSVPANNPFVGNTNYAPEIWAMGLRNPRTLSFDRSTGHLYVGDVGFANQEINYQPVANAGGKNYGWPILDGTNIFDPPVGFTNYAGLTGPVVSYTGTSRRSVRGGYVYRGPDSPRMNGVYFFGDAITGSIWALVNAATNGQWSQISQTPYLLIDTFGEDEEGRLYLADYETAKVYEVRDSHQVFTPVFSQPGGTINTNVVTVTCATPSAIIYYTTNGVDPTELDAPIASGGTLQIHTDITYKLRAFRSDLNPSDVESAVFTLVVATPVFNMPEGLVSYGTGIAISCVTSGAQIYYTVDGTVPTTNSPLYSTPVVLGSRAILQARAYRAEWMPSDVQAASYTLADLEHTVVTTLAGGITPGFSNAIGTLARFSNPQGMCIDRVGNLYVADTGNNVIRKITPSGQATTFAGTGVAGSGLGQATNAQFTAPTSVAIDQTGNLYVADSANSNRICKIATNGIVTALAGLASIPFFEHPSFWQIETDAAGNVYVGSGKAVLRVSPDGSVAKIAGPSPLSTAQTACSGGWCPGVGLGLDASTNLYVSTGPLLYKLSPDTTLDVFAGDPTSNFGGPLPGYSDGPRLRSLFSNPQLIIWAMPIPYKDVVVDSTTNIFVSDENRIRKIAGSGWVSTMAGAVEQGYQDGLGSAAKFHGVTGLCAGTNGVVYVADSGNNCIRMISPDSFGIGIPDWWQLAHFGYIGIDPNADSDHDGESNYAEFLAGTNPNSFLRFTEISLQTNSVRLTWRGGTNVPQYLQRAPNLNGVDSWVDIFTNLTSVSLSNGVFLDSPLSNAASYYRIRVGP